MDAISCLHGFSIQGNFEPARRNYTRVWRMLRDHAARGELPTRHPLPPLHLHLIGRGAVENLGLPEEVAPLTTVHFNEKYPDYYERVGGRGRGSAERGLGLGGVMGVAAPQSALWQAGGGARRRRCARRALPARASPGPLLPRARTRERPPPHSSPPRRAAQIHHTNALLLVLGSASYTTSKMSSTLVSSLITGTPVVADEGLLAAYSADFLPREAAFVMREGEDEVDAMLRVGRFPLPSPARRRVASRFGAWGRRAHPPRLGPLACAAANMPRAAPPRAHLEPTFSHLEPTLSPAQPTPARPSPA